MSMLLQDFSVIIDRGISTSGHGREVVNGHNAIGKIFHLQLISTVKLQGAKSYDKIMVILTGTYTSDVSLARNFQKHLSNEAQKHGVLDQAK